MKLAKATVMVCDDDEAVRDLLAIALSEAGIAVVPVGTGDAACERLKSGGIDMLLLDRQMPGIPGEEALRRIKSDPATRAVPVVMLTCADDMPTISHCLELGAAEFISKPVNLALLVKVIVRVLEFGATAPARPPEADELPDPSTLSADVQRMGEVLGPILLELQRRYEAVVSESPDSVPHREAGVRISEMRIRLEELLRIVDPARGD